MGSDSNSTTFLVDEATPGAVAGRLRLFTFPVGQSVPWDDLRGRLAGDGGEVRQSKDWLSLPAGQQVLVVALRIDGGRD